MTTTIKKGRSLARRPIRSSIDKALDKVSAIALIKKNSLEDVRRFNETVEVALNLGVDPKQSTQMVRGSIVLPNGTGRSVRFIVFTTNEAVAKEAKEAGAIMAGGEELIAEIDEKNFLAFDCSIASPEIMPKLAKLAKKLGPRGLMPNPKTGTVTPDVMKAVDEVKRGKVNIKTDKTGIVHAIIGKVSFSEQELLENLDALLAAVKSLRPEGFKGKYLKSVHISTTMGSSVPVDVVFN